MIDDGPDPENPPAQPLPDPFQTHGAAMAAHLDGTRPWARFLAIMGFVAAGIMVVLSVFMLAATPFMESGLMGPFMSMIYLLGAVLYVVPCLYLNRYASSIAEISRGGGPRAMAEALDHQRRFWRIMGILTIVMLCFYALVFVVGILAALAAFLTQ